MVALENVQAGSFGGWLNGSGPQADIVISSRVRLARNLEGYPFVNRASREQQQEVWDRVAAALKGSRFFGHAHFVDIGESPTLDRVFLMERNLISREHAYRSGPRGVAVGSDEMMSVMVNEEDHIRLQVLRSGLCLEDAWWMIDILDDDLGGLFDYAFSEQLGFLTTCPTNVGTGLRASVMMHLPVLGMTGQLKEALKGVRGLNLAVRGLHGEGTKRVGDILQISNRTTMGKGEEEMIEEVERVSRRIVAREEKARRTLWRSSQVWVKEMIKGAGEKLLYSSSISTQEAMGCLSMIRLGAYLGLMGAIDLSRLNGLFIQIQPAHLQKIAGRRMGTMERDIKRASLIRRQLRKEGD